MQSARGVRRVRRRRLADSIAMAPRSLRPKWSSSSGWKAPSTRASGTRSRWSGELGPAGGVEKALQDVGGGDPVDDFGAALSGHVVRDHLAGDRRGGEALVPEGDRHVAQGQ